MPRPQQPEDRQRRDPGHVDPERAVDDLRRVGFGLRPPSRLGEQPRAGAQQVERPRLEIALHRVADPAIQPTPRVVVVARVDGAAHEVRERAGGVLVQVVVERERQALFLHRPAGDVAGIYPARADVVQRVRQHFDRPQTPRHVDRLLPNPHALLVLAGQHVQLRPVA